MTDKEIRITTGPSKDMLIGGVFYGVHQDYVFTLDGKEITALLRWIGSADRERKQFWIRIEDRETGFWYEGTYNAHTRRGKVTLLKERTVWYFAFKGSSSSSTVLTADADGIARAHWHGRTFEFNVDGDFVEMPNGERGCVFGSKAAANAAARNHMSAVTTP